MTSSTAASALAAVSTTQPKQVSYIASSPSAPPTNHTPGATRKRRRSSRKEPPAPQPAPLGEDVVAAIASYRPHKVPQAAWERISTATRATVTAYRPTNAGVGMSNVAGAIARFTLWVADQPSRADPAAPVAVAELLADGLVEAFVDAESGRMPAATLATYRSVLRRAVNGLAGRGKPGKLSYQSIQAPYTPAEVNTLVRLAGNQPTPATRRAMAAVLALGLGAGLDAADQRGVTPAHIHTATIPDGSTLTLVDVVGERPRTVVVAQQFVPLLTTAVDLHNQAGRVQATPLHGRSLTRRSVMTTVTDTLKTATGDPVEVSAARLRSTWLVAAMTAPVPLGTLMRAAGLRSARSLADLLPHCPDPDPETLAALLATLNLTAPSHAGGEQQ